MYRFVLGRRWLIRIIAGLLLVLACVRLGIWQLDRADERAADNAVLEANLAAEPVPVDEVLSTDQVVSAEDQWRSVVATGRYDADHQLVLRLRPVDGRTGVHVLTPLVTDAGVLLIDRGFVPSAGADLPEVAPPAAGDVQVITRVRVPETGRGIGGDPAEGTIRYVDVAALTEFLGEDTYQAWGELITENPASPEAPTVIAAPEVDSGPHLSYALQWFAFAVVGVVGFVLLVRTERRDQEHPIPDESSNTHPAEPAIDPPTGVGPDELATGRSPASRSRER